MEKKRLRNNIPHLELEREVRSRRMWNKWYAKAKIKKCVQEGVAANVLNVADHTKTVSTPSKSNWNEWNSIGMNWKENKKQGNETMDQGDSFKSTYMKGKREMGQ